MTDTEKVARLQAIERKIQTFIEKTGRGTLDEHIEPDLLFLTRVVREEIQQRWDRNGDGLAVTARERRR